MTINNNNQSMNRGDYMVRNSPQVLNRTQRIRVNHHLNAQNQIIKPVTKLNPPPKAVCRKFLDSLKPSAKKSKNKTIVINNNNTTEPLYWEEDIPPSRKVFDDGQQMRNIIKGNYKYNYHLKDNSV